MHIRKSVKSQEMQKAISQLQGTSCLFGYCWEPYLPSSIENVYLGKSPLCVNSIRGIL